MKHKLILFLLALTTSLSIWGGIASLLDQSPSSTSFEPGRWFHQTKTTPIMIADWPNCGQTGQAGQPCPKDGFGPTGNSRGGG